MDEMKTYNEWKAIGLYVKKGEKSLSRSADRKPLFSRGQVKGIEDVLKVLSDDTAPNTAPNVNIMKAVDIHLASFGFIPSDIELWLEENETVEQYPDAPEFGDHWMNLRPDG